MEYSAELRLFMSQLEQMKISKENYVLSLEKKAAEKVIEEKEKGFDEIEQKFENEELLSLSLKEAERRIKCLQTEIDLKEQIIMKNIRKAMDEADSLIQSITSNETHQKDLKLVTHDSRLKAENKEKNRKQSYEEFLNYERCKTSQQKLEEERKKLVDYAAEQQYNLNDLRKQLQNEEKHKIELQKQHIKLKLSLKQQAFQEAKEELISLRTENEVATKIEKDQKVFEQEIIKNKLKEKHLLEQRKAQLAYKQSLKMDQESRDEKYMLLLMELQAEEDKLETLRLQTRQRKEMQHRVAAQQVLAERKKRRKHMMDQFKQMEQEENAFHKTRELLLQEEEKKLLLTYLPHLGPFLSPYILEKMSNL